LVCVALGVCGGCEEDDVKEVDEEGMDVYG
jgi:hypothetical protein